MGVEHSALLGLKRMVRILCFAKGKSLACTYLPHCELDSIHSCVENLSMIVGTTDDGYHHTWVDRVLHEMVEEVDQQEQLPGLVG